MENIMKRKMIGELDDLKRLRYEVGSIRMDIYTLTCASLGFVASAFAILFIYLWVVNRLKGFFVYSILFIIISMVFLVCFWILSGIRENNQEEFLLKFSGRKNEQRNKRTKKVK